MNNYDACRHSNEQTMCRHESSDTPKCDHQTCLQKLYRNEIYEKRNLNCESPTDVCVHKCEMHFCGHTCECEYITLHDTHITQGLRETRIRYSRVYHPCPTDREIALNMQTNTPFVAFIQTLINKGANFVLSANFAFWIVRTLFVPILQFRYFLVRKWSVWQFTAYEAIWRFIQL